MELKTVKVCHPDNPGDWIIVNEGDAGFYHPFTDADVDVDVDLDADASAREAELRLLNWKDIRAIAGKLGLAKDDDQSWSDIIPSILQAEGLID